MPLQVSDKCLSILPEKLLLVLDIDSSSQEDFFFITSLPLPPKSFSLNISLRAGM